MLKLLKITLYTNFIIVIKIYIQNSIVIRFTQISIYAV